MKCPGQDMQYWNEGAIFEVDCPACGKPVEFFKDDTSRKCSSCGERFINPKLDFGCASYCQFASQCIGELPEEAAIEFQKGLLKDKLALAVKEQLSGDYDQLRFIADLAVEVEELSKLEKARLPVALALTYMQYLESEVRERLLSELSENGIDLAEVTILLESIGPEGDEWDIIADAKRVVSAKDMMKLNDVERVEKLALVCLTKSGKEMIEGIYRA